MLNRLEYIKLNNPLLTELDDEKILNLYHRQYYSDMDYNTFKQKATAPLEDYNKFILQSIKPREELRKVEGYNDGYAELFKQYPQEKIENWQSKGAMNTWEIWKNLKLLNCIPLVGATAEGFKNQKLLNIKEKIKYGTATEEEVNYFNTSMEKLAELQVRGTNVGGKIVNGVCGSVAFMGEMAITSTGLGALPAAASEIYKNYQTRKLNDNIAITDKGEVFFTEYNKLPAITLLKSLGDVLVSYSVEKFGGKLLNKGFNRLLSTTLLKNMGANKIAKIMNKPLSWVNRNAIKLLGKAGFNGVLEEYGEERLEDVIRTALNLDDKGYDIEAFKDALFPTIEDSLAELGVITILGAGGATISTTSQKLYDKLKSKNISPNDAINVIANTPELEKEKMLTKLNKIDEEQDNNTFNQRLNDFKQKLTNANVDEKEAENLTTLHSHIITNYANDLGISKTEIFDTIELEIENSTSHYTPYEVEYLNHPPYEEGQSEVHLNRPPYKGEQSTELTGGLDIYNQTMYKAPQENIADFVNDVLNNKLEKKKYFAYISKNGIEVEITSDTINHDLKGHNFKEKEWEDILYSLDNILDARENYKTNYFGNNNVVLLTQGNNGKYNIVITKINGRNKITTAFNTKESQIAPARLYNSGSKTSTISGLVNIINTLKSNVNKNNNTYLQTAFHGSPYNFDKFSLDHMGEGEGAQAHGYGLYFALDRRTAEGYKNNDNISVLSFIPKTAREIIRNIEEYPDYTYYYDIFTDNNPYSKIKEKQKNNKQYLKDGYITEEEYKQSNKILAEFLKKKVYNETSNEESKLYEVDIPNDSSMLFEDKSIKEQSKNIKETISILIKDSSISDKLYEELKYKIKDDTYLASDLYKDLSNDLGGDKQASELLNIYGIQGIRYNGRADGECAVVFDDKAISIIEKYNQSINTDLKLNKEIEILDISNTIKGKITKETIKQKIQELIDKKEPIETLSEPYMMELLNSKKGHIINGSQYGKLKPKNYNERNKQLLNLDYLIRNSILIEKVENTKKDKKPNIDNYYYFYTPIKDKNNTYIIKLVAENSKKNNIVNLYDVIVEKELLINNKGTESNLGSSQAGMEINNSSSLTIKQILQNVKDFNGNNALTSYFLENNNLSQNTQNNSYLKKGQISLTDTKAIITLFQETSDASTIIHEMGHYYMKLMEIMARKNPKAKEHLNKANNFIDKEIKRSNYQTQEDYEIARQEYFARSFEAYLRRGIAPSKELRNIFERFREWLFEVYNSIKELNVKLTPEVIDFFDNFIVNNKLLDSVDSSFEEYQKLQEEIYNEREALVLNQDLTPEEIDKVIDDKYSERLNKIYDEINNGEKQTLDDTFYNNLINYSKKNKDNNKFSRYFKSFGKYVKDCIRDSIANADEVIASIDPSLANKLKRFQTDIILTTDENKKKALPFFKTLEYIRKTNENDYLILDMALKNRDINKIQELTNKYNFYNEYINIRELLDNLREQAISVGIDVGYLNNYFPRQVDPKRKNEFISFLRANETGTYNDLLYNLEQLRNNKLFTQEDELKFINNFLRGFIPKDLILLTPNGNLKNPRSIEIITPEMAEYFLPSNIALQNYIEATTKDVITREAFGIEDKETRDLRNKLKEKHRQLKRAEETPAGKFKTNQEYKLTVNKAVMEKNLERLSHKTNLTIEEQEQLKNIQNEIESIETQIDNLQKTNAFAVKNNHIKQIKQEIEEIKDKLPSDKLEDSIANFVNSIENLDLEQNNILKKYISSIVNPAPSTTLTKIINNTAYGLALTSFKNALNQLPELAVSFYKNGFFNTVESIITRHKINMEDLGLEDMVGEINKKGLDFINKVLTLTGFNKIDMFGKNTFLNSNLIKTKKELINNNEDTNRDIEQLMTKDAEKVKEDILNDRMSFEVKEYLLMKLAGVQPILVSSRPYYYLNGGNARMFYTLKIFSIKQLNMLHNDILKKITSGDIKETITGLQNLIKYQAFLFMVGAPIDIIMGLATGYDDEDENLITDAMIDNLIIFNIMSRYTLSKAGKQGIGSATVDYLFTPVSFRFADDIYKDVKKLLIGELEFENWRTLKYVPFGKDLRTLKEVVDE